MFLGILFVFICCLAVFVFWAADKYTVPVVMYHNVARADVFRADTVSPENFEKHLKFLKTRGYCLLSLEELVDGMKAGRKFKRNSVAVTFDDGMKNNFLAAYPILKKYAVCAHFFVPVGRVGQDGVLSWEDIAVMKEGGMVFGSHSVNHAYLPGLSLDEQIHEIQASKKILEEKLNQSVHFFAYPIGGFNPQIKGLLQKSGYRAGFTTNRGTNRFTKDLYEINRIRFGDRDTNDFVLTAKLSGYYNLFRKLKKPE